MDFQPKDANYLNRVKEIYERQRFVHHLGAKLVDVRPGYVEITLPFQEPLSQQHGYFHGGAVGTLAYISTGYAAATLLEPDSSHATVEYKLNFLAPAAGSALVARGKVIKPGKTLIVCASDIFAVDHGREKPCAMATATFIATSSKT